MTVQIVSRDGVIDFEEDVKRIEVDKENGNRIKLYKDYSECSMPCYDFTSIIILRTEQFISKEIKEK